MSSCRFTTLFASKHGHPITNGTLQRAVPTISEVGPVPTGRSLDLAGRNRPYSTVSFLLDRQIDQGRCVMADQLKFFAVVGASFFLFDTRS